MPNEEFIYKLSFVTVAAIREDLNKYLKDSSTGDEVETTGQIARLEQIMIHFLSGE